MSDASTVAWWRPVPVDRPVPQRLVAAPSTDGRVAFAAMAVFTFVLVIAPQEFVPSLAVVRPALVAAITASLACLWRGSAHASWRRHPREGLIAMMLLAWAVVTIPVSVWPGGSVAKLTDLFGKALVTFWLLGQVVDTVPRLRGVCWLLSLLTVPLALTGLWHFAQGDFAAGAGSRIEGYGSGLAANPNDLALTLDIVIPLTIGVALSARHWVSRAGAVAIAGLDVAAVVATYSRGGFVTLAVIALGCTAWLIERRKTLALVVVCAAAVMAVPLVPASYLNRLRTISNFNSDPTGSEQDRWRDTVTAMRIVESHPLIGAGLGNDAIVLNEARGVTWRSVHDAYLNYAVDLGLPGLGLFLALFVSVLVTTRRIARAARRVAGEAELAALARGLAIALWAFAVAAFFYPVAYQFYFYYLAGLALGLQTIVRRMAGGYAEGLAQ